MINLSVPLPEHSYSILIEPGILQKAGLFCRQVLSPQASIFIIADENTAPLYAGLLAASLKQAEFPVHTLVLPPGESSKSVAMLEHIYNELASWHITRTDAVLALGGGVMGDLAGLAAATILRGVDFIQVPTTLLAQVDSSVGGKTAVNLSAGKNLVGAFYQPKLVLIDPLVLHTLNSREFSCGMAEIIKYGCIQNSSLFQKLEKAGNRSNIMEQIESVLQTCCSIKADIVTRDEKESGLRKILNFGHTLGHAYELAYHYETYTHGEAVAAGMCLAADLGVYLKITPQETARHIHDLVKKFELPEKISCSPADYKKAFALDKKAESNSITLILLSKLGESVCQKMSQEELLHHLHHIESRS